MSDLYGILCKFPEPGRVKTRLASDIGPEAAAGVYRSIAERIMRNTAGHPRVVFFSPQSAANEFRQWLPGEKLLPQTGGDIGEIMQNALMALFDLGAQKAVITGSDIPALNRDIIAEALDVLEVADVVIGPASDGGYYLIGMKAPHRGIFHGIAWGGRSVYKETLDAIRRAGLTVSPVAMLSDVDTAEDLRNLPPG